MKKIAILVSTLGIGGAEKQSIYLLNALRNKYEITLIVFYGDIIDSKIINLIEDNNYKLIKQKGNLFRKLLFLYKFFKSNQITHLFTYLTKPNFYGSIIAKRAGVKYIYTGIRSTVLPKWKIILEKFAAKYFCTKVIFNSYCGEVIFKQKGFKNTIVIPNCFLNISHPFKRAQKSKLKIITVGRFVKQKDLFTAINAIKELRKKNENFVFQIVGYGQLEDQMRNKVAELELTKNVEIIISPDNVTALLNEADIYLSTSIFEGTSNSIMEAMNASLPVVATNVGDNNRLISEGKNGFLHNVGDYEAIAQSLKTLIDDYKTRIEFGAESNRMLKENYSYEKFKEEYLKLMVQ